MNDAPSLTQRVRDALRTDSAFWRRALTAGVRHGPDPWVRYSPPVFGMAFSVALASQRRSVRRTLRKVLGPRSTAVELRDVAEVFANFASSMTDALLLGSDRGYMPISRPLGDWNFLSSWAQGRGVIMATAQTAGWDIAGAIMHAMRLHGEPERAPSVMVVMEREPNARAREMHDRMRERGGIKVAHVGNDPLSALPVLQHLRRHRGIVALKFDRCPPGMRTRAVRFLGEPWRIPEGPLMLAAASGAPIVPTFTRRLGFLEYQPISHPPIYLPRRPDERQLNDAAQRMADALESFVRAHPTHWFRFSDG